MGHALGENNDVFFWNASNGKKGKKVVDRIWANYLELSIAYQVLHSKLAEILQII